MVVAKVPMRARFTDISQAHKLIDTTRIYALAVCIGNVNGKYPASGPKLKFDLLKDLYDLSSNKGVFIVLHGASGLPKEMVKECIKLGVRKFNVNTEVCKAYMDAINESSKKDLIDVMRFLLKVTYYLYLVGEIRSSLIGTSKPCNLILHITIQVPIETEV